MKKSNRLISFKKRFSLAYRLKESKRIMKKYSGRIPIICERADTSDIELINKNKYAIIRYTVCDCFIIIISSI